jgi:transglutaminase/protease-like cytokinesis protein 3
LQILRKAVAEGKTGKIHYGRNNSIIVIAATVLCLAATSITMMHSNKGNAARSEDSGYSISRQIQYSFTLQNKSHQVIKQAELWTFAPVKQTASQRCLRLLSNYPYKLLIDDSGNQVLHFTFENLAPYGSRVVTIKANLLVSATANPIPSGPSPRDLNPQKYIESNHSAITGIAHKLQAPDASKTIEEAFRWVAGNVRYSGYAGRDRGALYALEHKKGDCTEYANLFVALCRANGIAARPIGGYVCPQSGVLKARDYHNWVEFYKNGTWQLADPQNRVLMRNAADYIAMRIIHGSEDDPMSPYNRFRFKGEGLEVKMN